MSDDELLEWYKKNGSSKPADMSNQDYELNVNKALKLQQDNVLKQNLESQQSVIDKSKSNSLQSASISNEKLMKYLGQTQLASGVAKGQANSDFINANNNYITNRADIENNAVQQQKELLNNYASDKLANEQTAHNNEISILDKYRQQTVEDGKREGEKADKAYNELMTVIESQSFNSVAELENLYNKYKDNISDSQKVMVEHAIDYYKNNPAQQGIEQNTDSEAVLLGKKYLNYNGADYQITGEALGNDNKTNQALYYAVKNVLGKNNPYDSTIENGTSISYKDVIISGAIGQGLTKEQAESELRPLYSEYKNHYMTYYNGEWYISQKR